MKQFYTFLMLVSFSSLVYAQQSQRTPADPAEAFEKDPTVYNQSRDRIPNAEAMAVLTTVRSQVQARAQQGDKTSTPPTMTLEEYQTLLTNADNFLVAKNYSQAALLYKEVVANRTDQYASDKLIQLEALQARQAKTDSIAKADATERAKAEFAHSKFSVRDVHFSGGLMSDVLESVGISSAFKEDAFSNILSYGKYNNLELYLPKAVSKTFDGIAIPAHTRVVIYQEKEYKGKVLLDVTGPAIINNTIWSKDARYSFVNTKEYTPEIQALFPQEVRVWSDSNMHFWTKGSIEIIYVP